MGVGIGGGMLTFFLFCFNFFSLALLRCFDGSYRWYHYHTLADYVC